MSSATTSRTRFCEVAAGFGPTGARFDQVLAVVQDEEQLASFEEPHKGVEQRIPSAFAPPEDCRDGEGNQVGNLERGQIHPPYAVGKQIHEVRGHKQRQLGLPAATGPSQGHEAPGRAQSQVPHRGTVLFAPDQLRVWHWQVVAQRGDLGSLTTRSTRRGPTSSQVVNHSVETLTQMCGRADHLRM